MAWPIGALRLSGPPRSYLLLNLVYSIGTPYRHAHCARSRNSVSPHLVAQEFGYLRGNRRAATASSAPPSQAGGPAYVSYGHPTRGSQPSTRHETDAGGDSKLPTALMAQNSPRPLPTKRLSLLQHGVHGTFRQIWRIPILLQNPLHKHTHLRAHVLAHRPVDGRAPPHLLY